MKEPTVHEEYTDTKASAYVGMTRRDFVGVLISGVIAGLAAFVLYYLLNKFVFGAVLCRAESTGDCSQAPAYSMIVAIIISTIAGVANLARLRVYRPLLAGLATAVALWGLQSLVTGVAWYWAGLVFVALFTLSYAAFAWVARLRNFILALVVTVVLVVLVRWVLVA